MRRMTRTNETLPDVFAKLDRERFLRDVAELVEEEVGTQSGITGFAIRGSYRIAQGIRPDFLSAALRQLFPAFASRLGEVVSKKTDEQSYEELFRQEEERVTAVLLAVADERAEKIQLRAVRAAYQKIRSQAEKNVRNAVPRLGGILDRHAR